MIAAWLASSPTYLQTVTNKVLAQSPSLAYKGHKSPFPYLQVLHFTEVAEY